MGWWGLSKQERAQKFKEAVEYNPAKSFSASFGTDAVIDAGRCFIDSGIPVGESPESGKTVYFPRRIRPHICTFGGSGIGKSSYIEKILLNWKQAAIVFDPTGEHAAQTWKWRAKNGPVYQWNPLGILPRQLGSLPRVRLNPIGPHYLNPRLPSLDSRAATSASTIISKVDGHNRYFYDSPRGMWAAIEIWLAMYGRPGQQNLPYIARELVRGDMEAHARYMISKCNDPFLKARFRRFLGGEARAKSINEFIETAITDSEFLLDRPVAESLTIADITFAPFKRRPQTLYVIAPLEAIKTFGPTNKLLLGSMLAELFQWDEKANTECLIVMDELFQYGRDLEALPAAIAAGRKYNVVLHSCLTSVSELRAMLPDDFEAVLNNMGMIQFLDCYDVPTSELVSKLLGNTEILTHTKNLNYDPTRFTIGACMGLDLDQMEVERAPSEDNLKHLHVSQTFSREKKPLMWPQELRQDLGLTEQIVVMRDCPKPLRLNRKPFWETSDRFKASPNPYYRSGKSGDANTFWKWLME